jgi:hypothetical protein
LTDKIAIYPAKKAANANVAYNAEFEFALVVESTWPPAPSPFKALKRPLISERKWQNVAFAMGGTAYLGT